MCVCVSLSLCAVAIQIMIQERVISLKRKRFLQIITLNESVTKWPHGVIHISRFVWGVLCDGGVQNNKVWGVAIISLHTTYIQ